MYRLCIRYTYLQENIADNYSEALVNFFKYITTYDPQRSILNWIHIVTKRFVMEQNRRHGRLPVSENVDVYSLASSLSDEDDTHGNAMGMENYREFYNDDILNAPRFAQTHLPGSPAASTGGIQVGRDRRDFIPQRQHEKPEPRHDEEPDFPAKQQMRKLITPDGEKR